MKPATFNKARSPDLNEAYNRVMRLFFSRPTREASLNDITSAAGVSKSTANRVVKQLAREGFLKVEKLGKLWRIRCDQQHPYNTTRKIAFNLEAIFGSGVIEAVLSRFQNPRAVILFGSYRKGDDIETSDIDIAVETFGDNDVKIIDIGKVPLMGYRRNVKVEVLQFSRNRIDLNLFSNLANGIVLYGFLEARP